MVTETETAIVRPVESDEDLKRVVELMSSGSIEDLASSQADEPGCIRMLLRNDEVVGALAHKRETWSIGQA